MKYLKSAEIRNLFLEYFSKNGHEIIPSSSLVPQDDPTLLFTNAGMVQFKQVFLGLEHRPFVRAATCQKCVRAGGKHNDLENVGYTARHHTFFEMLGNFSFGDYFKKDAIFFAWDFLTKIIELPKERLWVTVFRDDDEAARLWQEVAGISKDRIVRLGEKDNFWAMGDTGPCGPCSEILFDQGEDVGCRRPDCKVGCDCDRFLEIWNLVFMEFFRDESGSLTPLPKQNIDTGMGLERISAVCQGKRNNFDSDCFSWIIEKISHLSRMSYGKDASMDTAMRVIADHARATSFLVADGIMPSNEGRGYVLRRVMRRAIRYGRTLGFSGPFLGKVCQSVVDEMGDVYPELISSSSFLQKVVGHEESRFLETLEYGLELLEERLNILRDKIIPGDFIFKLYDTYGFPVDIVQDVANEKGLELDKAGFEAAMKEQRQRSKKAHHEVTAEKLPAHYLELLEKGKGGIFVGYDNLSCSSFILSLSQGNIPFDKVNKGWKGELVSQETPFYPESGGQTGDTGMVFGPRGKARVTDTIKMGELVIHKVEVIEGNLETGERIDLQVTEGKRLDTARNHTATHLLHASLRKILGDHVKQAGSLVSPERMRFDFTHFSSLEPSEIRWVEDMVNEKIREDLALKIEILSYNEAVEKGAMALFGEKYGEKVRLVSVPDFSRELCGGTHLARTGQIGLFKIISESSIQSGVRRIEAVTGKAALDYVHQMEDEFSLLSTELKCPKAELPQRARSLVKRVKSMEKELLQVQTQPKGMDIDDLISGFRYVKGIKVLSISSDVTDPRTMRELADRIRDKMGSGVMVLGGKTDGKAIILASVTKDLTDKIKANEIIRSLANMIGGSGGGKPHLAQAGGPATEKLHEALDHAYNLVDSLI